jgi:alanine dehydrogenase
MLTVGVFGTSKKKNEQRVPIHPKHLDWIDSKIRPNLYFEEGYGLPFFVEDKEIASGFGGILPRAQLFKKCDVILLPKPVLEDFKEMRENSILWGWPHCVQQFEIAQAAIDKRLTLIAWEAMNKWGRKGDWQMHIFSKNNELAGYASVTHALGIRGIDGIYGSQKKCVVISFGSVSRGAVYALFGRGFNDITVYTQRHALHVGDQMARVSNYRHFDEDDSGRLLSVHPEGNAYPFIEDLKTADIIVNGILQDTDHPLMFLEDSEVDQLKPGCLIIDISCDEGMGFPFAKPTSFENPMIQVGKTSYYAVDHSPSYLWNSASWEISNSLIPYLPIVMRGKKSWEKNQTIRRAIEIMDGQIQNPKILSFQKRDSEYPHEVQY